MTENIFATNEDENLDAGEEFGDFALPTLSLADVEEPEETPRYVRIPQNTRLDFEIYSAEFALSSNKGTPGWKLELVLANEADQDVYGPKKRIFKDIWITEKTMKPFVKPFLKAVGIELNGPLTKKFVVQEVPETVLGNKISFQVVGYEWKHPTEGRQQNFGRGKVALPTDEQLKEWGVYLNEKVENALPAKGDEDNDGAAEGLSEFDASNFV